MFIHVSTPSNYFQRRLGPTKKPISSEGCKEMSAPTSLTWTMLHLCWKAISCHALQKSWHQSSQSLLLELGTYPREASGTLSMYEDMLLPKRCSGSNRTTRNTMGRLSLTHEDSEPCQRRTYLRRSLTLCTSPPMWVLLIRKVMDIYSERKWNLVSCLMHDA